MRKGDELYEAEAKGNIDEQNSIDEWINMVENKYLVTFNIAGEDMDLDFNDDFINRVDDWNYDKDEAEMEKQRRTKECNMQIM
jgi:hypothetical protein